jgi:hypothetical protein
MSCSTKKCKTEVEALELQVAGNDVVKNAFDDKKWYCHKQTLTPSYQNPDMTNVTAEYKLDKNNVVQIKNCGVRASGKQECVSFLRGILPKGETKAKFIVKPRLVPSIFARKTNYWILDQIKDSLMIISEGNPKLQDSDCMHRPAVGQGLWIMTNSAVRDDTLIDIADMKIKALGINTGNMIDITHN